MVAPLALLGAKAALSVVSGIANAVTGAGSASSAKAGAADKAKKTAGDFETMFLENSLERMTQDMGENGPLGENGTGGSVYRSMLVKEYAGQIAKSGGVGIADQVYRQLIQLQERGSHGAS